MPLPNKFSIYAGPPIQAALAHLSDEASRSGRLNTVAERYLETVKRSTPEMSEAEWCGIVDALNGTILDPLLIRVMHMEIEESDGLGEKWGLDQRALADRLSGLPYAALVAIAEIVERFWAASREDGSYRDRLARAGARIG